MKLNYFGGKMIEMHTPCHTEASQSSTRLMQTCTARSVPLQLLSKYTWQNRERRDDIYIRSILIAIENSDKNS